MCSSILASVSGWVASQFDPSLNWKDVEWIRKLWPGKLIIKGILDRKLPWALVLLGAMIAVTLEMLGIPALAFAVGVYLPLSSSAPIFVGGLIRWLVDRKQRASLKSSNLSEEQLIAESDKSPGVLLSSGYIAGGAIAGNANGQSPPESRLRRNSFRKKALASKPKQLSASSPSCPSLESFRQTSSSLPSAPRFPDAPVY